MYIEKPMCKNFLQFRNISISINGVVLCSELNFDIGGFSCFEILNPCSSLEYLPCFFSRTQNQYENCVVTFSGDVYFNGRYLPAGSLEHLQNQYILFDRNDTVKETLKMIDIGRAMHYIEVLGVYFKEKRLKSLTIEESRKFEILVNLVSAPRFIYLDNIDIMRSEKKKYFRELKKLVKTEECVSLLRTESRKYYDYFLFIDGMSGLKSLSRRGYEKYKYNIDVRSIENFKIYYIDEEVDMILLKSIVVEPEIEDLKEEKRALIENSKTTKSGRNSVKEDVKICEMPLYDLKNIYRPYYTEYILKESEEPSVQILDSFLEMGIYKIHFTQSIKIAQYKYRLMTEVYYKSKNIFCTGITFFIAVTCIKLLFSVYENCRLSDGPFLIFLAVYICSSRSKTSALVSIYIYLEYVFCMLNPFLSFFRMLKKDNGSGEFRLIQSALYICSLDFIPLIYDEEWKYLKAYVNKTVTPGTYIFSMIMYLLFLHLISIYVIGYVFFNIKHNLLNIINSVFLAIHIAGYKGKRNVDTSVIFVSFMNIININIKSKPIKHAVELGVMALSPFYFMKYGYEYKIPVLYLFTIYIAIYIFSCARLHSIVNLL